MIPLCITEMLNVIEEDNLPFMSTTCTLSLKGTVARDFLAWVFFMDLLYMGLGF
jgi:hypothetical protein